MYKAYVFRMYPDEKQKELINKSFGVSRFIYNHFLEEKHTIAKHLTTIPLHGIINMLKYKSERDGKKLLQINRYYPSSQICSICDYKNKKKNYLSIRKWECPICHNKHDRGINASQNIMFEG